jgi:hypothetical protein
MRAIPVMCANPNSIADRHRAAHASRQPLEALVDRYRHGHTVFPNAGARERQRRDAHGRARPAADRDTTPPTLHILRCCQVGRHLVIASVSVRMIAHFPSRPEHGNLEPKSRCNRDATGSPHDCVICAAFAAGGGIGTNQNGPERTGLPTIRNRTGIHRVAIHRCPRDRHLCRTNSRSWIIFPFDVDQVIA